ncbi:hypothetical protein LOAG_02357 [Loa loa]|uniref:Uncharacterized protein n=1 Tax=Loa loa TaxID=7209 RepID=A0A1S0U7D4_LOALO|nr:hypothetical protein LOAG_02357 [Loa loa]EFO26123.1 hypothetical protein LOAG_02357 [Loa loa]
MAGVDAEISQKRELSMTDSVTPLERISELEEGLLGVPELLDDSDELSSASLIGMEDRNSLSRFLNDAKEAKDFFRVDENYDCNIAQHGNTTQQNAATLQ